MDYMRLKQKSEKTKYEIGRKKQKIELLEMKNDIKKHKTEVVEKSAKAFILQQIENG